MHTIEPHYNWDIFYLSSEDERSPFFGREYSDFECTDSIYNHYIHPQWDNIGSATLFIKILFVDYDEGYGIIELMGEWNDTLHNDIMILKRNIIETMIYQGITKFVLIAENVLNFHRSDDCYYEEWFDEVESGWITLLNARDHVLQEFKDANIDQYFLLGGSLNSISWRTHQPLSFCQRIDEIAKKRLGE